MLGSAVAAAATAAASLRSCCFSSGAVAAAAAEAAGVGASATKASISSDLPSATAASAVGWLGETAVIVFEGPQPIRTVVGGDGVSGSLRKQLSVLCFRY